MPAMRYLYNVLLLISWGLWLGATLATFVFGLHLFHTHADVAPVANSAMFEIFAIYELPLMGVALLATGLIVVSYRSKPAIGLLLLLILAGGLSVTSGLGFTPAMEALRLQGKGHSPAFMRLHMKSVITMSAQAVLLMAAGSFIPMVMPRPSHTGSAGPRTGGFEVVQKTKSSEPNDEAHSD